MGNTETFRVVLADHDWPDLRLENNIFCSLGVEFLATNCTTEEDLIAVASNADAIIAEYAPISKNVIKHLSRCKLIALNAIGYGNVDIASATQAGIMVTNCPGYCCDEVADHTIALLLACGRGIVNFDQSISRKIWDFKSAGTLSRLRDSTLGLIGYGKIAEAVAYRARAFGMNVMAWDPFGKAKEGAYIAYGVQKTSLDEILHSSDYISVHAPLTDETRHLISTIEIAAMKRTPYLLNLGRGGVIDENALTEALKVGRIRGAALDVLETEPPDFSHELFGMSNVIITPHAAFYSEESISEVRTRTAKEVVRVIGGELPENLFNPSVVREPRKMRATKSIKTT